MGVLGLVGRVLIALVFLGSGVSKITDFGGTQQYMSSYGMPFPVLFLVGAILLEIGGGVSVAAGYRTRWGALALLVFLVPATFIFHFEPGVREQFVHMMKNAAIGGALLLLMAEGPGAMSLDERLQREASRQT